MTFTVPADLAEQLNRQVRLLRRPAFVATAIADRMEAERQRLIDACEAANADSDDARLRREMDPLPDTLANDPWIDPVP